MIASTSSDSSKAFSVKIHEGQATLVYLGCELLRAMLTHLTTHGASFCAVALCRVRATLQKRLEQVPRGLKIGVH